MRTRAPGLASISLLLPAAIAVGAGCDAGETKLIGADYPAAMCDVPPRTPPSRFDSFYGKYLDANGIPVLSSSDVSDVALTQACVIAARMLSARDDVRQAMMGQQEQVVVIGRNEVTTNIPEYRNLYSMFPGQDWDQLRGVGATLMIPVSSAGEENLLCHAGDSFKGESILVQTFATAVLLGLESADGTFDSRLQAAYDAALNADLWRDTYAAVNTIEYYAEGVQDWYDANGEATPPDGTHNQVNTRAELRSYDPTLAGLVQETVPDDAWRPKCP
jgi:hypothetical protein